MLTGIKSGAFPDETVREIILLTDTDDKIGTDQPAFKLTFNFRIFGNAGGDY